MTKILCIDDEPALLADLSEVLSEEGYDVLTAEDGREGLAAILAHKPDLVISDVTMPRMGGYELLSELRRNHREFAATPFIFLSALANRADVIEGLKLGADDYLTKPVDFEMMLVRIGAELTRKEQVKRRHDEVQVKLYKALTGQGTAAAQCAPAEDPAPVAQSAPAAQADVSGERLHSLPDAPRPKLPPLRINLVGCVCPSLEQVRSWLEQDGHQVAVFSSGTDYMAKSEWFEAHLTFFWYQSDDVNASAVMALIDKPKGISVLVASEDNPMPPNVVVRTTHKLTLPVSHDRLVAQIFQWGRTGRRR